MPDPPRWATPGQGPEDPGQPPYGQSPPSQPQWGQPQYGQPQYGQPQYGQPPYGQPPWGQPQWGAYGAPYKPGIVPLRPMGVGEILDGAFTNLRRNPGATLGLSAAVITVVELVRLGAELAFRDARGAASGALFVLTSLLSFVATLLLAGALTVVIGEAVLGGKIRAGAAVARLRPRLPGLLGLSVLVTLLTALGLLALVIGAIYVGVLLSLATPAYVLEGGGIRAAMRRSRELVRGSWWRVLWVLLLAAVVTSIVSGVILFVPLTLVGASAGPGFVDTGGDLSTGALVVVTLASIVAGTIVQPVQAGVTALLYVDRRMRKEGLDVALARAAGERAGTARPPG